MVNMSEKQTTLVSKREALQMVIDHIERPGVVDVNTFIELLTWERKLLLWVLQESAEKQNSQVHISRELQNQLKQAAQ